MEVVKSLAQFNDAVGWISVILVYHHEFLFNSCDSFICLLFSMYFLGAVGLKRSVWIGFECVDIVKSLNKFDDADECISVILVYHHKFLVNSCDSFIFFVQYELCSCSGTVKD